MYKEYRVSFDGHHNSKKPEGKKQASISCNLSPCILTYDFLAKRVAEKGCTFCPAVYNGKRKSENFKSQQLFVVDIDDYATYAEMKERADRYNLPILFAYKTFSWTPEKDKFRLVFALDCEITDARTAKIITAIFMHIFNECDKSCKDLARMFYGSTNGLYYLADEPQEISFRELIIAYNCYMFDLHDEAHYTRELGKFYTGIDPHFVVKLNGKVPFYGIDGYGSPVISTISRTASPISKSEYQVKNKGERRKTSKVDFDELEKQCRLFRDFRSGKEYYFYPQLFHIATNLVNMEKGKQEFMNILESPANEGYAAYHERSWKPILNAIIDLGYYPQSCRRCPYCDECLHYKNMILTVKPGYCGIKQVEPREYCSIEEAEKSLEENFHAAVSSEISGLKILKAQTGIGKTNICLKYLKSSESSYILAVPTHKLAREIYQKALNMGISNIRLVPELPKLSDDIRDELERLYSIGCSGMGLGYLRGMQLSLPKGNDDKIKLENYFSELDDALGYSGHIIMTHERLLCLKPDSDIIVDHKVIIDEDILRSIYPTVTVSKMDIEKALDSEAFNKKARKRLNDILSGYKYQRYFSSVKSVINIDNLDELDGISTNVCDLLHARVLVKDGDMITYIKAMNLPCSSAVIMSATAEPDLYRELVCGNVYEYNCKCAKNKGRIMQYANSSYSRRALTNDEKSGDLLKMVHDIVGDDKVITFACIENEFDTRYHYGGIEGLNCLEGENISVIGLPNIDEKVYKLYGMLMDIDPYSEKLKNTKIVYNGYEFYLNTFDNCKLRHIQLWMINSLLEQAVGRARLLRNDCTVKVFARFPVDQAEVM